MRLQSRPGSELEHGDPSVSYPFRVNELMALGRSEKNSESILLIIRFLDSEGQRRLRPGCGDLTRRRWRLKSLHPTISICTFGECSLSCTEVQPGFDNFMPRDGDMMETVLPHSSRTFRRAVIMPNLVPPITNAEVEDAFS